MRVEFLRMINRISVVAGIGLIGTMSSVYAAPVQLTPHRAVYEMTLERALSGSGIVDMTGRMVYELTGDACRGYSQNMRFVTKSVARNGKESIMDLRSKFWEDAAGRNFTFDTDHFSDDKLKESAAGKVERNAGDGGISVRLAKPRRKRFNVTGDVLFPVQHTVEILEAAKAGKTVFTSDLYDGSEKGAKVYTTTAVFGKPISSSSAPALPRVANAEPLDELSAWPVALSYFDSGNSREDALPSYELSFLFYENGVSRRLLIDYGHLAIRGRLTKLEFLKQSPCAK
jgi:hypothetical protein